MTTEVLKLAAMKVLADWQKFAESAPQNDALEALEWGCDA